MDPARIAIRALAAYVYLLYTTRATGKRVVAQATAFDFVVALILGDLIDDALWAEVSFARFAVAVASILCADVIAKILIKRSPVLFKIIAGRPRLVLRHGHEDRGELRHLQMNAGDLSSLLRKQEIEDWREVRAGHVETDGQLSVLKEPHAEPLQRRDRDKVKELIA